LVKIKNGLPTNFAKKLSGLAADVRATKGNKLSQKQINIFSRSKEQLSGST
jgi:hypothetical protein